MNKIFVGFWVVIVFLLGQNLGIISIAEAQEGTVLAKVQILNAAQLPETLDITLCKELEPPYKEAEPTCFTTRLKHGQAADKFLVPRGTYRFRVESLGKKLYFLDDFQTSFIQGDSYAIVLYGASTTYVEETLKSKLIRIFGGNDKVRKNGYQIAHKVIMMSPPSGGEESQIRLLNVAPGSDDLVLKVIGSNAEPIFLGPEPYSSLSKNIQIPTGVIRYQLSWVDSKVPLEMGTFAVKPQSQIVIVAEGMRSGHTLEVKMIADSFP